jgi:hypothetical protein
MNWLHYLAEANIYLGVFYLTYCLFLTKETYYTFNRVYLLVCCVLAFALPLIQLGFLKPSVAIITGTIDAPVIAERFTWQDGLLYSYITGVLILAIQFALKLYQLHKLARLKPAYSDKDYKLIRLEGSNVAFSFFNYLFIGAEAAEPELITRHELVHIRQKHSADVMFLELLKIINWFNPAIYLLQNSIKTVHEYIADEQTALAATDPTAYSTFLVNNAYGISGPSFTHLFFNYNLLKKRIIMLHQKRSGSLARLKYLIAVPLCAGLLCESTLGFSKTYGFVNIGGNGATGALQDTIKKGTQVTIVKTRTTKSMPATKDHPVDVILTPPPPPLPNGKVTKVTHLKGTKNHPPVVITDVILTPPPPPLPPVKGKVTKVTHVAATKSHRAVIITDVKLTPPPPPPLPPAKKIQR